ncbi:hypothetical protein [Embleya sp. NPDC001921]
MAERPLRMGDPVEHVPPPGGTRHPDGLLETEDPGAAEVWVFSAVAPGHLGGLRWSAPRDEIQRRT